MIAVRVSPKASRSAITGVFDGPEGAALKVAVTAPADRGRANAAVADLLAAAFGIAKSRVTLRGGETDRRKLFHLAGEPGTLAAIAQQWMTP